MKQTNLRHEAFCQKYLNDEKYKFNATRIYMLIYPKASYQTAMANSSRLLRKARARIAELMIPYTEEGQMQAIAQGMMRAVNSDDPSVSLATIKLWLKIQGIL